MPAPTITITITEALARRGTPTDTGPAFAVFASAATGPDAPVKVTTAAGVTDAYGTTAAITTLAAQVARALTEGAPSVTLVKVAPGASGAEPDWAGGLDLLSDALGPGQVLIPGVATPGAHAALVAHVGAHPGRVALLDADPGASAAELATTATALAGEDGAERATIVAGAVTFPGPAATSRTIPASLVAAGLAARGDSRVGHANHAPILTHSGGAGQVAAQPDAASVAPVFTQSELDDLYDAGVCCFIMVNGTPTLGGWVSLRRDAIYSQLNIGRLLAQITAGTKDGLAQYLGRQIDGRGLLYAEVEGSLRAYLLDLYSRDALYGAVPDDAFDVAVAAINSPADAAAGLLKAAVSLTPSKYAEAITLSIIVHTAGA